MHLSAAIRGGGGGGWPQGAPGHLHNNILQIPPTQNQDCLTKSYWHPSPGGKEVCTAKSKGAVFQKSSICHN